MQFKKGFVGLWDRLIGDGVVVTTLAEIVEASGSTYGSAKIAVAEAQRRNLVFSPVRGLYVLVPAQFRRQGVVPTTWFIDDVCRHLGRKYYVGYLSAAAQHGAAHQAVQVNQIVVDRDVRDRKVGKQVIWFYSDVRIDARPVKKVDGPTGGLVVATPETCAWDLAEHPSRGGGVGNVATILSDLELNSGKLKAQIRTRPAAAALRLGYLLEVIDSDADLSALEAVASTHRGVTLLNPKERHGGEVNQRWRICVNTRVEFDRDEREAR